MYIINLLYHMKGIFPYNEALRGSGLRSLSGRSKEAGLLFQYNLIHSKLSCSEILEKICRRVPSHGVRRNEIFSITFPKTRQCSLFLFPFIVNTVQSVGKETR